MSKNLRIAGLALAAVLVFAPLASAQRPYAPYGPRYGFYYGWYGSGWWGGYETAWYGPYVYVPSAMTGKVKIDTKATKSEVYVDGGYAGTVKQLGTFQLTVGTHDIELRDHNEKFFQQHVNVIAGKTTDIKVPSGVSRG